MEILKSLPFIFYVACSAALMAYGLHHYFVLYLFWRVRKNIRSDNEEIERRHAIGTGKTGAPPVLVQIPLYNESTVAERIIRSAAAIDYPALTIQVLDDSDDETSDIVDATVQELAAQGLDISAVRRQDRTGFKAGALQYGMTLCDAPYIAIFDSDFIPPADFLKRTLPHFLANEHCGIVQARWDHLNPEDSALTRAQSVGIDGHFVIEQVARSYNGYFLNFNGTAGVWRRDAIGEAGGWQADTLTEDLDLSYRAQLRGWTIHYLPHLTVPAELPPLFRSFRSQQFRWAKGSMQTARKMLPVIWKSPISLRKKVEATFHLTHYAIHLCMFFQALLGLPIALLGTFPFSSSAWLWFMAPMGLAMLGPSLLYLAAELWIDSRRLTYFFARLPMLLMLGFGICMSNARACLEGLLGITSPFVRTPKRGDTPSKNRYRGKGGFLPVFEAALALLALTTATYYLLIGIPGVAPFFMLYALGFGTFGICSWMEGRS